MQAFQHACEVWNYFVAVEYVALLDKSLPRQINGVSDGIPSFAGYNDQSKHGELGGENRQETRDLTS